MKFEILVLKTLMLIVALLLHRTLPEDQKIAIGIQRLKLALSANTVIDEVLAYVTELEKKEG